MKKITLFTALLSLLALPALAAFPAFPMSFWGVATINGSPAPVGTVIRAYYGNNIAGEISVKENGVYGYIEATKQKLLVGEGAGSISFKFQTPSFNGGVETNGASQQTHEGFVSGAIVNKSLEFTIVIAAPASQGGSGGSSGGGGGGGGSASIAPVAPTSVVNSPAINAAAQSVDANKDGKVDILDFNSVMISWGSAVQNNSADFNTDGKVDIFDFNLLMINWTQ